MRAAKSAARPKIAKRGRAERAALGIALRCLHLLMNALKEVRHIRLRGGGKRGLYSTFGRTPLAEVE
ncbi:MAG TPA: hypothetical protein VM099_00940 [Gemmatimonadaceae bacterium]|nr:hypothetical protein [Gemmatimonadaceae bacterium]